MGRHGAHKFRRGEHGAFDMKMPIDQTWRQICAFEINCLPRLITAEADNPAILHGDMRFVNFTAENVDDARVFEQLFHRLFTPRNR